MPLTQVQPGMLGTPQPYNFKNRIINGAMVVNQRGGTVTSASGGTYGVDRFAIYSNGGGVLTAVQSSTVPTGQGFVNSNLLTVTTADSSIASSDFYSYAQAIEGYNIADLQWGTASAKTITLSFWVNSSITGLFAVALINADGSRCYPATYTITSANTWQQITLTVAGDTGGTWGTTNGQGILVRYDLGSGSNVNGTANTWNTAGSFVGARTSSTVNWISNSGATFYITGVQLEQGVTATSFDVRSYGTELGLCQRYYVGLLEYWFTVGADPSYPTGNYGGLPWSYQMRTTPSVVIASGGMTGHHAIAPSATTGAINGVALTFSGSAYRSGVSTSANVALTLSAEL